MRVAMNQLNGRKFDVVVVGGGVNGTSAAQHLSAAGYSVLLAEKNDFAAGASGMSSRLLHCGLRYLAPGSSMSEFFRHPGKLRTALRMAGQAMRSRGQMVGMTPQRVRPLTFCFPVWQDSQYAGWQVDLAFKILAALGPRDVPLDYRRLQLDQVARTPLIQGLRDKESLSSVATFREYQFEWPDRICVDTVLDARRMGATVLNYTAVSGFERLSTEQWKVSLTDQFTFETAQITADIVLNTAGIWIDNVGEMIKGKQPKRRVLGTKGTHIMVQLPPECQEYGIATLNRAMEPFYCVPWRGMHYFGPTETVYEGDPDDVRPLEQEIEWLLGEANHLLPALNLRRSDVLFSWSGVRPLTYDPAFPKGKRSREIHDYSADGLPGFLAMTAGPIMTHRSAGEELREIVAARIEPSGTPVEMSFSSEKMPREHSDVPLTPEWPSVGKKDVEHSSEHEAVFRLSDLMFHRIGLAWTESMGYESAETVARIAAPFLGWDDAKIAQEVKEYRQHLHTFHLIQRPVDGTNPSA